MPDPVFSKFFGVRVWSESPIGATVYYADRAACPLCRRRTIGDYNWQRAECDIIGRDARHWNDFIGAVSGMLIKDRVVQDLVDFGITGFAAHPIPIDKVESKMLRTTATPGYYLFDATGRIDIDRQTFDQNDGIVCEVCHAWNPRKGGMVGGGEKRLFPLEETWSGEDFMRLGNIAFGPVFCTAKVVEVARLKKWTGFGIAGFSSDMPRIDLHDPDWRQRMEEAIDGKCPWANGRG